MNELHFHVTDASHKPFNVLIRKDGHNLTALCSCSNGKEGLCQHRLNILCGLTEGVINARNEDLRQLASWIDGTDVGEALVAMVQANTRLMNAQDDFAIARKRLAEAMLD